ncbi:MAG: EamA family transporter [Patescibacteria group bacterium]|jgi:drug/metabolite transporter (DMT)-like permease
MWQLLVLLYFVFGTANYLLRQVLAKKLGEYNRLINSVFFLFFLLPATVILFWFFPHNLNVGLLNLLFLLGGSLIWPIANIVAFEGNKKVDVGIFTIINNLSPIFTLIIALPFLHESLKTLQFLGVGLLILSGVLAASSQLNKKSLVSINGILICLLSAVIMGVAVAYERFMLSQVDFGTYLIYGWGAQITWGAILAHKELKKLPHLFSKALGARQTLVTWGATGVLKSIAFVLALKMSTASVISAATDFLSVAVVIAAYFYLKERQHIISKALAVAAGVAGLLLIAK